MCTLTYTPLREGFILTSSRDEAPHRKALKPKKQVYQGVELVFPQDEQSQGSWLVSNDEDRVSSLLNGGLRRHERKLPYRMSRGIVHLDLYLHAGLEEFARKYNFSGIEPFTIVSVEPSGIFQLIWTGEEVIVNTFSKDESHIWSSSMLYTEEMKSQRQKWFNQWKMERAPFDQEDMFDFHTHSFTDDKTVDIIMNRENKVRTTSITQVVCEEGSMQYRFFEV
jgi:hypothetical protein